MAAKMTRRERELQERCDDLANELAQIRDKISQLNRLIEGAGAAPLGSASGRSVFELEKRIYDLLEELKLAKKSLVLAQGAAKDATTSELHKIIVEIGTRASR